MMVCKVSESVATASAVVIQIGDRSFRLDILQEHTPVQGLWTMPSAISDSETDPSYVLADYGV